MNNRDLIPEVIITDFDRTIAYLYRDTTLLTELNKRIVDFYSKQIKIPNEIINRSEDGYFVWHKLHDFAEIILGEKAISINKQAEDLVTNFEIEVIEKVGMIENIKETCQTLIDMGIKLGIVSNNGENAIRYALRKEGIVDMFDYIGGRPFPFNPKLIKPNPYPINEAVKRMDVDKNQVIWYTGDDVMDMVAATNANVVAVGIYYGRHSKEDLIKNGAELTFPSFSDIVYYLKSK